MLRESERNKRLIASAVWLVQQYRYVRGEELWCEDSDRLILEYGVLSVAPSRITRQASTKYEIDLAVLGSPNTGRKPYTSMYTTKISRGTRGLPFGCMCASDIKYDPWL